MPIDQWWNFFYLCGSSAATLTGLTFIAVTFGSTLIKKDNLDQVNTFISPFCFHFLHVFFLCCITAIPNVNCRFLAIVIILSALLRLMALPGACKVIRTQAKKEGTGVELSDWITVVLLPVAVYLALLVAGTGFWLNQAWAIDVLAISCLTLLLGSAKGAWDMLVWIASTLS